MGSIGNRRCGNHHTNHNTNFSSYHERKASSDLYDNHHDYDDDDSYYHHQHHRRENPPKEYICSISGSLMADPVIVPPGQTFERVSVEMCRDLGFFPTLEDGYKLDFSNVISNMALRRAILNWCDRTGTPHPRTPNYSTVEGIVRDLMAEDILKQQKQSAAAGSSESELLRGVADKPPVTLNHAETEIHPRVNPFDSISSDNNGELPAIGRKSTETPLPFTTRPSCYSSSSSSTEFPSIETLRKSVDSFSIGSEEQRQLISKLNSLEVYDQEEAVISLRRITRSSKEARVSLCTPPILSALRSLISSRYSKVQVNAVASLVNLSLEKRNKVQIVRSELVTPLIDILRAGFSEAQEHAAGALFSLALEDENKIAIGALNALPPLLHAVRSENERTQHDSGLCLYQLSLTQINRVKLVKLGAVPILISMAKVKKSASWALLILCNLAVCTEGRSALLDGHGVGFLVEMLRENESGSESTQETCVSALHSLSQGGLRFKGLAREARAVEVLKGVEERGSERAREKAKKILRIMKGREYEEEEANGGESNSAAEGGGLSWTRPRSGGGGRNFHSPNSRYTSNF